MRLICGPYRISASPLPVAGGLWANALSLRDQLTLELAGPHRFAAHGSPAAQDGAVGQRVQFDARKTHAVFTIPEAAKTLVLADCCVLPKEWQAGLDARVRLRGVMKKPLAR